MIDCCVDAVQLSKLIINLKYIEFNHKYADTEIIAEQRYLFLENRMQRTSHRNDLFTHPSNFMDKKSP